MFFNPIVILHKNCRHTYLFTPKRNDFTLKEYKSTLISKKVVFGDYSF